MNRLIIIFSFLLLTTSVKAGYAISGEYSVTPYKPYNYIWGLVTGMSTMAANDFKLVVTNGKIMDSSGNYTLTSLAVDGFYGDTYIIWECASSGKIELYLNNSVVADWYVNIQSCNLTISNQTFSSSSYSYERAYITMQNVTVRSGATLTVHGYQSVSILPGFLAEAGSKVIIKSGIPAPQTRSSVNTAQEITTRLDEFGKEESYLGQNFPNPVERNTTITCYIPNESQNNVIHILNVNGILVKECKLDNQGLNEILLDTSNFSNGIYFYSLIIDGQVIETKRMIVL